MIVRYIEDLYCRHTVEVYTAIVQAGSPFMVWFEDQPSRLINIHRELSLTTAF